MQNTMVPVDRTPLLRLCMTLILLTALALGASCKRKGAGGGAAPESIIEVAPSLASQPAAVRLMHEFLTLLPKELPDAPMISSVAETNSVNPDYIRAMVKGSYANENGRRVEILLSDMGTSREAMSLVPGLDWLPIEIDRELAAGGYERTYEFRGWKSYRKYDAEAFYGMVQILVGDRILFELIGYNISAVNLTNFVEKIDFDRLKELADE